MYMYHNSYSAIDILYTLFNNSFIIVIIICIFLTYIMILCYSTILLLHPNSNKQKKIIHLHTEITSVKKYY